MRISLWLAVLASVLASDVCESVDKNGGYTTLIKREESGCSTFVAARDDARRGDYGRENKYLAWLSGYITAYNAEVSDTYDIMGAKDMPSLLLWLENECRQNPLEEFTKATEHLMIWLYPDRTRSGPEDTP